MKVAVIRLLSLTLLSLICGSWGFFGHKKINRHAVFSLPPEMIGFYKSHIEYLSQHAVDPDKRRYVSEGEAVKHYIDLDHFYQEGEDPFELIPQNWFLAVDKFCEDSLKTYGILPWNINWVHKRLTKAFETKDVNSILSLSADLGHYIGDAHVPLHTTENYNGQLSGQRGIHGLWESRIPELEAKNYDLMCGRASYLPNPLETTWEIVKESHLLLDSVLKLEKEVSKSIGYDQKYAMEGRGAQTSLQYSQKFALAYSSAMGEMVENRMKMAIYRISCFWFTAWVNAGQPDLDGMQLGTQLEESKDSLEAAYQQALEIKGRSHDQ